MSFEIPAEISLGNHSTSFGIFVLLIPISSLVLELKGSKLDIILRSDIATLKMLVDVHEPIVSVHGLDASTERLWLICEELVEGSKLRLIVDVALALVPLVALTLISLLHELNQHLSVGVGGHHQSLPCLRRRRRRRRVRLLSFVTARILTCWRSHPEEDDIR